TTRVDCCSRYTVFLSHSTMFCLLFFFFSSRRRHTRSVSAFLLNRSSDLCLLKLKILTSRLSLSKHLAHNLGNLLLLGKIGVFHRSEERRVGKECRSRWLGYH